MKALTLIAMALVLGQAGPRTVRDRANARYREVGTNYDLHEVRPDFKSNLFASYDLAGNPDAGFTDTGPNSLTLPVVSNLYPQLVTDNGITSTLFSRYTTSGSTATSTNYGRLTNIDQTLYQTFGAGPVTGSCWFKRTVSGAGESTGAENPLVAGADGSGVSLSRNAATFQMLITRSTNTIRLQWGSDTGVQSNVFAPNIPYNAWHHYAITLVAGAANKAHALLYIDGELVEVGADKNQPWHWILAPDKGAIAICGGNASAVNQCGGYVYRARLWSRALSAADIKALYDNGG
jgi:hypothetical protein